MAATKNLVAVLTALLSFFSSSTSSAAAATNGLSRPSTDSIIREAIFLDIEDARSTGNFLVALSALESVRDGNGEFRECISHLLTTVEDIRFGLETIWGDLIMNPGNLPDDITKIKEEIEKIVASDSTCSASLDTENNDVRNTLENRLGGFRKSMKEVMNLVRQLDPSLAAESGKQ